MTTGPFNSVPFSRVPLLASTVHLERTFACGRVEVARLVQAWGTNARSGTFGASGLLAHPMMLGALLRRSAQARTEVGLLSGPLKGVRWVCQRASLVRHLDGGAAVGYRSPFIGA